MRILTPALLLVTLPLFAFGELDDNTLTVTSSRPLVLQPDQVVFWVSANFESTATLDDVLPAVQSAGITLADLINVSALPALTNVGLALTQTTEWSFSVQVPFSKLGAELSTLAALQQSFSKSAIRSLSYYVQGTQVSPQLRASAVCGYPALLEDASAQARALASAAGLMLGPVVAVSDGTGVNPLPTAVFAAISLTGIPVIRQGAFVYQPPTSLQANCTMSVQFKLVH